MVKYVIYYNEISDIILANVLHLSTVIDSIYITHVCASDNNCTGGY